MLKKNLATMLYDSFLFFLLKLRVAIVFLKSLKFNMIIVGNKK